MVEGFTPCLELKLAEPIGFCRGVLGGIPNPEMFWPPPALVSLDPGVFFAIYDFLLFTYELRNASDTKTTELLVGEAIALLDKWNKLPYSSWTISTEEQRPPGK